MQCPQCHSPLLKVHVSFAGDVACQFSGSQHLHEFQILEKVALQSEFDDDAACRCMSCSWDGRVADTVRFPVGRRPRQPRAKSIYCTPLSPEELSAISEETQAFEAAPKQIVERLVGEVHRLNSLLETVIRLSGASNGSDGDTCVG